MATKSTTQHTPGPWTIGHRFDDGDIQLLNRSGNMTIVIVHDHSVGSTEHEPEEAIANARLIASAPDMLLTLRESHRVLENMFRAKPGDKTLPVVIRWMEETIAKATGA